MNERIACILTFLLGGLVGAAIGYKFAFNKAEERADTEIEEMREYFLQKSGNQKPIKVEDAAEKSRQSQNKPSVVELAKVKEAPEVEKVNYTLYSEEQPENPVVTSEPVLIQQDEFGDILHYSRVNLTYYDDRILADDLTMKTFKKDDVDKIIGLKSLEEFKKIDKTGRPVTQIWVRNDRTKTYYSIVTDEREYAVAAAGMGDNDEEY